MKKVSTLLFVLMISYSAIGQSLPAMFHFSADGHRLIRGGLPTEGLYHEMTIDTIFLQFDQPNYWQQLTANYQPKINIAATMQFKGQTYDSVGVRFRGQTSYSFVQSSQKKSFNITLDWVHDQDIEGYETFNLINGYGDASFMREVFFLNRSRHHIPSAKANWVQLYINGQNWGIYSSVQQLDRKHASEWFTERNATRWRAEKTIAGPGFGAGFSSLNWLGWDTTVYKNYYTIKKWYVDNPWDDLVKTINVLNNTPSALLADSLSNHLDIDGALWFLAHEILFTDDDSYVNKGGMDYYLYYDIGTKRLVPIEYDANSCMSSQLASSWSPFYRETSNTYPLMSKLMAVPELRQRYLAHLRTIINQSFDVESMSALIDAFAAKIQPHVFSDPKKIYTNNAFTQEIPKLKQFITTRRNFIMNNAEVNRSGPVIANVVFKTDGVDFAYPTSGQSVVVNAHITAAQGIHQVFLHFGTGFMGKFSKLLMYDDGQHNDGAAGDGIFGAELPAFPTGTYVRFYIEARANDTWKTAKFEPVGAEHDVYIYQVVTGNVGGIPVVINELMPDNSNAVPDQNGEYDDWVELYNLSAEAFDLSGFYLSDKMDQLNRWQFPAGTIIPGNGYLVVWCDNHLTQAGLHANFALSKSGEDVVLSTPDLQIVDAIAFPAAPANKSYARVPNGTGNFVWQDHTFMASNDGVVSITENAAKKEFNIYPNPTNASFTILSEGTENLRIKVYSTEGKNLLNLDACSSCTIHTTYWKRGIYIIRSESGHTEKLVVY